MLQYAVTRYAFVVVAAGAAFGTGGFLLAVSIIEDIKSILKSVNKDAKSRKNYSKTLNRFSDFIKIHSILKQLSCESHNSFFLDQRIITFYRNFARFIHGFVRIFQPMLVAIFMWSMVTICGTMLMFQVELVEYFSYLRKI